MASFIGYKAHWLTLDVLYRVYVSPSGVAGCRVGGQIVTAREEDDPRSFASPDLLARYPKEESQPADHQFLDSKNLWLPRELVRDVRVRSRRSLWAGAITNSGSVRLRARDAPVWRLVLLGRQDPEEIKRLFSSSGYLVI